MKTVYDVMQFLKRFGTFIYTKDRLADLEMMEDELRELYNSKLMDVKDYQMATLILRQEMMKIKRQRQQ
ncbi:YqgQ family protein [Viridibacillus sp. YIM B01967]|uniref:YqgQ family protein n=1 Tax=Viridibacillus soli TaxID=2798301 RepID=A0ABS1H3W2_9BACL|nr:YqgQ family protein [Viridibacillus soli]MBK3493994.1 YqgQ family protein [Viridibacillus soli]